MPDSVSSEVHLVVLVHGMWGNVSNLAEMKKAIDERKGDKDVDGITLVSLLATANQLESTYDGIDWGGERVAEEVLAEIDRLEKEGQKVTRFSITGYSLGGLVSRYVIGILHQRKTFDKIMPVNFNTLATPHIGLLRYPSWFSRIASVLGPRFLSRTGEQFYAVDKWSAKGRPLLEVMADPDRIFYQALCLFPHVRIYANAVNDMTVPYLTAAIESNDPFIDHKTNGLNLELDEKYGPIIKSWHVPDTPPPQPEKPRALTKKWFKSLRMPMLPLPPRLQWRFPFSLVLWVALPVLIPSFLTMAMVRFTISGRSSRQRIKLLENDPSMESRLIRVFADLERQMEDVIVGMEEDSGMITPPSPSPKAGGTLAASKDLRMSTAEAAAVKASLGEQASQVILTPGQHQMIAWLNSIPQLQKERAFIDNIRNSHGSIIARDIENWPHMEIGLGVLRHWADAFVL